MEETKIKLPKLSASEERSFKTCRLGHHFEYDLGYRLVLPNRKLSTGIIFHEGANAHYNGLSKSEALAVVSTLCDERWQEILDGNASMSGYTEALLTFEKDRALVAALVGGFIDWLHESGVDDNYETVETEVAHLIEIPGACAVIPIRMDLVQRDLRTERLRIVDFKTCKGFPSDMTGYYMAEQNGNYQLATLAVFDELPTEMLYRFARKIIPSGRSKPPYFKDAPITLTNQELLYRIEEFKKVATERFDPDRAIYPQPENCCGSWKNDWRRPCTLVHQGYSPEQALAEAAGYERSDAYARYDDLKEVE